MKIGKSGSSWYIYDQTQPEIAAYDDYKRAESLATSLNSGNYTKKYVAIKKFAKGGVISSSNSSGLDYLAKKFREDHVVFAKDGERVLTPVQNEMWEKWTDALPKLLENINIQPKLNLHTFNSDFVNRSAIQPITLSIGDIHLNNVQNVDSLANAIVKELPSKVIQSINKR